MTSFEVFQLSNYVIR